MYFYIERGKITFKDGVAFHTCKDACNCFGYHYNNYQRGGIKHLLQDDMLIWFPKLYPNGEWLNRISLDGTIIWGNNVDPVKNANFIPKWLNDKRSIRIVFVQERDSLEFMRYRFKGVFKLNPERTLTERCAVWMRIAEEIETMSR